jgi:hypothetical protein
MVRDRNEGVTNWTNRLFIDFLLVAVLYYFIKH